MGRSIFKWSKNSRRIRRKREGLKNVDTSPYDIDVTEQGVEVTLKGEGGEGEQTPPTDETEPITPPVATIPEDWKENVTAIVDGVPIPKGFTASSATGENTKAGGLVIYEGAEEVNDTNVEDARRNKNQYVWIPVDSSTFEAKFVRSNFGRSNTLSNALGTNYWEVILDATNMPSTSQSTSYVSSTTLAEVQSMYASVKKYGGFYIARYEAGIETQRTSDSEAIVTGTNVYSRMNKIPYNNVGWSSSSTMNVDTGGAVEVARSIYPNKASNTTGVVSTLTYGVQWDTVMQWYIDTGALTQEEIATDCTDYGNYLNHDIATSKELNTGTKYTTSGTTTFSNITESYTKSSTTAHILTTGALKVANINNVYDMAGNMLEWTMEGYATNKRLSRGGYYNYYGYYNPAAHRSNNGPDDSSADIGFRPSLYIK